MLRRIAFFGAGVFLAGFVRIAGAQEPPSPAPIHVYADAIDRKGARMLPDLSMLAAYIDGKPTRVLSVQPAESEKLLFAVMVDISSSGREQQKLLKDAAAKIFAALTNQNGTGYLVLFNNQTYVTKQPVQPAEADAILDHASFTGATSLYDAVAQIASGVLSKSQNPGTPRRVIVVLSDGKDNYSNLTLDAAEKSVQREGVTVFMLSQLSGDAASKGEYVIDELTRSSGGRGMEDGMMLNKVPALINAIQSQIELTIVPAQAIGGKLHSLSIKTTQKSIAITAPAAIPIP